MTKSSDPFLPLLKSVSRSFYLSVRILPSRVRRPIGLAYLLARATDTMADTDLLPAELRIDMLDRTRNAIASGRTGDYGAGMSDCMCSQSDASERRLLEVLPLALQALERQPEGDKKLIIGVLRTIISGQLLDLNRFKGSDQTRITALTNEADLEDYTYRVAGCVGEFWTRLCSTHLYDEVTGWDEASMIALGIDFGKGLQLVNILRDLRSDLGMGRCYFPETELEKLSLRPSDLVGHAREVEFLPLYRRYVSRARTLLMHGWEYTCQLPYQPIRLKLACAWPVLIGLETLNRLEGARILSGKERIKISRKEVRKTIWKSIALLPFRSKWECLPHTLPYCSS